jgi:hypothetical protein
VRVTNAGGGVYHLVQVVDDVPDGAPLGLAAGDLPDGAFALLFGAGRSFVVEDVIVTAGRLAQGDSPQAVAREQLFATKTREHRDLTETLEKELATPAGVEVAWVSDGSPEPPRVFLLRRGLYGERGEEVTPAGLSVLTDPDHSFEVVPAAGGTTTGRRLALAEWMRSTAFRQSSAPHATGLAADPRSRLLWRFPLQRLDAESIRDTMLAVGGDLDDAIGGPPVMLQGLDGHGTNGEVEPCQTPGRQRRTLYVQRRRSALPTFLQVFDLPGITATCAERPCSTVPLQSLAQLNSGFSRGRAGALADRLIGAAADEEARVRLAFTLCIGREPGPADRAAAVAFLHEQEQIHAPAADAPRRALVDLCQVMFASNAFLYID